MSNLNTRFLLLRCLSSLAEETKYLYICAMMPKRYIRLSEPEIEQLETELRKSPIHRVRIRCQALLWSHQGKDRVTIAELLDVQADTVSGWFNRWAEQKLSSLVDLPKSGRPSILSTVEKKSS
jgi:hypothetical protein